MTRHDDLYESRPRPCPICNDRGYFFEEDDDGPKHMRQVRCVCSPLSVVVPIPFGRHGKGELVYDEADWPATAARAILDELAVPPFSGVRERTPQEKIDFANAIILELLMNRPAESSVAWVQKVVAMVREKIK